jgi:hypothetical protein
MRSILALVSLRDIPDLLIFDVIPTMHNV